MEELKPQDIEDLLQELKEEDRTQESLPTEVEELLRVLQSGGLYLDRQVAAEALGKVAVSSPGIIRALTAAEESDSYPEVRRAAAKSLHNPVHQEYLQQHPDLEATERAEPKPLEPDEVELLLPILESGSHHLAREAAAEQLGSVATSSARTVRALIAASQSDPHPDVRRAATGSLRAPVNKEYLLQHPDLMEVTETALQQRPGVDKWRPQVPATRETGRGRADRQAKGLIRCLIASSVAGLAVGLVIGLWDADQSLFHGGGLTCGTGFLVALTVGALVGAVVGAFAGGAEQERGHRIANIILAAVLSAVVAAVSWWPISVLRVVLLGGP